MNIWTFLTILFIASADIRVVGQECQRSETRLTYTEAGCASGTQTNDFCSPGKRLINRCEGECDYCGEDEYQNEFTDCSTCLKCTTGEDCCEGQELTSDCSSVRNAVCGCPPCSTVTCPPMPTPDLPVEPSFQQNCPSDITIEAEEGATGSTVNWTEPVVSNASSAVQSHYPGSRFRIGYTDVFYAFSGSTGNMITCSFVINVEEAPPTTSTVDPVDPVSTTTDQPEVSSRCVNPVPTTTDQPDPVPTTLDSPDPVPTTLDSPDSDQSSSCDGRTVCCAVLGIITFVLVLLCGGLMYLLYSCHRDRKDQQNCAAVPPQQPPNGQQNPQPPPQQANGNRKEDEDQVDYICDVNEDALLLEENGANAPANPPGENDKTKASQVVDLPNDKNVNTPLRSNIGPSDQQCQFEPEKLGDQHVDEHELSILASSIYSQYVGNAIKDVEHFFCVLHTPNGIFDRVQFENQYAGTEAILFRVFRSWHSTNPLTRNKFGEALLKFDQLKNTSLCELYVHIVQECCQDNDSS